MTGSVPLSGWAPGRRWRRAPWWAQVLGVYALARVVSAVALLAVAHFQVANLWTPAAPSYLQFTGLMWDASWYRGIAEQGYPAELPLAADGSVEQNAWAFFPLFPLLVRGLMTITGASWETAAPLLALALGGAAMVVIYRLVEVGAPRAVDARPGLPLATVALVAFFPTAVVLQIGYTESLALLLIASAVLLMIRGRYLAAATVVLALGFTRAVALPMAAVVLVHAVARWRASRRGLVAQPRTAVLAQPRNLSGQGVLLLAAVVAGIAWPAVCAAVTGTPDGYLRTQAAWRARPDVVPFLPWLDIARWLIGGWAPVLLLVVGAALTLLLASAPARRLGPELLAWPIAYLAYLVAVVEPGTSLARFLLLAFPIAAVTAGVAHRSAARRRAWLIAVVLVMVFLQFGWVWTLWRLTPPSGWPP